MSPEEREIREAKEALRHLSYGVYVVSSMDGDRINAMTVRMVSQVSTRPPQLSIVIRKRSLTHELICESGVFAVHVLAKGQELLGGHFGLRSGRQISKFAGVDYQRGCTGAPILDECQTWMECRVRASHEVGHSVLLIGEVVNAGQGTLHNRPALIYRKSDYYG